MSSPVARFCLLAALFLAVPPELPGQQPSRTADANQEQVQRWTEESERIARRLEEIQERTLEDPALRRMNEALGAEVQAAMAKADSGLARELARIPEMESRAREAEERGDRAALRDLTAELREIERRYQAAQAAALGDAELAAKVRFFNSLLQRRMVATDPETSRLLARFQELNARLAGEEEGDPPAR